MSMPQTVTVNPAREVADELEEILASCDSVYPWNGGHMKPHPPPFSSEARFGSRRRAVEAGVSAVGACKRARRPAAHVLLGAVLCLALVGCDDGDSDGDGNGLLQVYFATNNIKECTPLTVDVNLAAAGANIAHLDDGSLNCGLDGALSSSGCSGAFSLTDGGNTLHAVIDGCAVPLETNLFRCAFVEGDISLLNANTSSVCDCVGEPICHLNIYCDATPTICVNEDADPHACEDCFNDVDDDGDGDVDCRDDNCHVIDCGWGQTTITCTTTTTTTTIFGATSTTLAGP